MNWDFLLRRGRNGNVHVWDITRTKQSKIVYYSVSAETRGNVLALVRAGAAAAKGWFSLGLQLHCHPELAKEHHCIAIVGTARVLNCNIMSQSLFISVVRNCHVWRFAIPASDHSVIAVALREWFVYGRDRQLALVLIVLIMLPNLFTQSGRFSNQYTLAVS